MDRDNTNWKVLYTASRQEKKVARYLEDAGVSFYLPMVKKLRVWSDRKKWVEMPLFGGYVFVKPDAAQRTRVLEIPGVVKYLRYNGQDALASDAEIQLIKTLIEKGYELDEYSGDVDFQRGDRVKVVSGPMKSYQGEILSLGGERFAFLVLSGFGHTVKVKLPKQVLRKIEE